MNPNEPSVLLVEDNPGDIRMARDGLGKTRFRPRVDVAQTGEEALARLDLVCEEATPPPWLVLLDLNLPRVGGLEVLLRVKTDPRLARIPVVVLTGSDAHQDIETAYGLHANSYLIKPADPDDYDRLLVAVAEFWLGMARLSSATRRDPCWNT